MNKSQSTGKHIAPSTADTYDKEELEYLHSQIGHYPIVGSGRHSQAVAA